MKIQIELPDGISPELFNKSILQIGLKLVIGDNGYKLKRCPKIISCSVSGCLRDAAVDGMCPQHWMRSARNDRL